MKRSIQAYTLALAGFLTLALFASYKYKNAEPVNGANPIAKALPNIPQVVKSIDLDRPFDFAGEPLPMQNRDVRERLDRELLVNTYWHSSTMLNIKNTYKFFPAMERILAKYELPDDFKYLAVAESNLRNEVSPAGAKGFWQFMKNTGAYYDLEINSEVDERYHYEKATEAACKYLLGYKKKFGSWTLAAAAYNMGGPKLDKALNEQRGKTFYDLNLNAETNRYIFRLVAIKEIMKNPSDFGFYLEEDDVYRPLDDYKEIEVKGSIPNLGDFAIEHGTSYRMLKFYNPWLISSKLTNASRKTYQIRIPK